MRLESYDYISSVINEVYGEDRDKLTRVFDKLDGLTLKFSSKQLMKNMATQMLLDGNTVIDVSNALDMKYITVYKQKENLFKENII